MLGILGSVDSVRYSGITHRLQRVGELIKKTSNKSETNLEPEQELQLSTYHIKLVAQAIPLMVRETSSG